tara:strand:+ start:352 stop:717 length:366 start_codon:yes stop_codon:yes gene_type:complete
MLSILYLTNRGGSGISVLSSRLMCISRGANGGSVVVLITRPFILGDVLKTKLSSAGGIFSISITVWVERNEEYMEEDDDKEDDDKEDDDKEDEDEFEEDEHDELLDLNNWSRHSGQLVFSF